MRLKPQAFLFAAASLACAAGASAQQTNDALKSAVQKAINGNPEVTARFNAYRASADAIDVARGGYFPRVDLTANAGRDNDRITSRNPESESINRAGFALGLTQLLWDGLATRNDVSRLGHERLARYFEVLDVTEQTALEATRAYYDVLRYRRLVSLAEDNYVQHRSAYNQLQSRFKAGVGRGVDLEQAGARLALAQSNLSTEVSNLHDVSARYQRVIGEAPAKEMPAPQSLTQALPGSAIDASIEAIRRSPAISASIESLRSARGLAAARESAYQPKLEAHLRAGGGTNFDGIRDQKRDTSAELLLSWNLFNGGSDRARIRQQWNLVNQAADLRDKACRDTRQTVAIAYNDTRKLVDQLKYLDRNTLAIEKARDAYRQQFDIGQRSLLDLLNAENELYTARRSYANADFDLAIAYARTHASINQLTVQLGLVRGDRGDNSAEPPADANDWTVGEDGPTRCPVVPVDIMVIDTAALDQRAAAGVSGTAPQPLAPAPLFVPLPPATAAPGKAPAAAMRPHPVPIPPLATPPASAALHRLNEWAAAWQSKDASRYLSFYAPSFSPKNGSSVQWQAKRRAALAKPGAIDVKIDKVQTQTQGPGSVETRFQQSYTSPHFRDVTNKSLIWKSIRGEWYIVRESDR